MPLQLQYAQKPASRSHKQAWDTLNWFLPMRHTLLPAIALQMMAPLKDGRATSAIQFVPGMQ